LIVVKLFNPVMGHRGRDHMPW